ncbi:transforming growth factor-beta-induced protein ig-h3-like [Ornithodoros turicata]|uniref:transforming growth factor-beta-induced protein ig-h3-like n=1 Tax=Ornithodoros turicata TaxID=34597 RepID=UPI0031388D24
MAQKQGPNTCAVEEVPELNWKFYTECKYWMHRNICGFRTTIRYECCEGYAQIRGERGCVGVKPLVTAVELARQLGARKFVHYLEDSGLLKELDNVVTLFAPTDDAFEKLSKIEKLKFEGNLADNLMQHVLSGRVKIQEAEGDLKNSAGGSLYLTRYSNGITTVNCVPVIRRDHEAKDGIVHLIGGVLFPSSQNTLPELLREDGRFRELARMLLQSRPLLGTLRSNGPFTILAPSDEAFQELPPLELRRISQDINVTLAVVQNHIVPKPLCSPAVTDRQHVKTLSGESVEVHCNASGVYVNDHKFTGEILLGKNGHLSVITGILMPKRAKSLVDLIFERSDILSTFMSLLEDTGLAAALAEGTFTIFAPSNAAFEKAAPPNTTEELVHLLQHHVIHNERIRSDDFKDDRELPTWEGHGTLRLKVYRKSVGVDVAIITEADIEGYNGIMHVIDEVLVPRQESVLDLLQKDEQYSLFTEALKRAAGMQLLGNITTHTIFAPTNDAFQRYAGHLNNTETLQKILRNHIVDGIISTGSFRSPTLAYDLQSEQSQTLRVRHRAHNDHITVNRAHIVKKDLLGRDGIVHCIDQVLMPPL